MRNNTGYRKSEQVIYGVHSVNEALQAGKEIEKVIIQNNVHGEWVPEIRKMLNEREIPIQFLPSEAMNRLVRGNHQGIAAFLSPFSTKRLKLLFRWYMKPANHRLSLCSIVLPMSETWEP